MKSGRAEERKKGRKKGRKEERKNNGSLEAAGMKNKRNMING
jgi:hypothetical protein